jgi:ABC-2 type transport system ATP-binding protein
VLEADHLTKFYSGVPAVRDVSFRVEPGEVLGYLGPNGSGKTTTIGMMMGLLEPTGGRVLFDGRDIQSDLIAYRRRVGYVPEEPHLYPFLSGREYLQLVGRLREMPASVLEPRITRLLELFDLDRHSEQAIGAYSKGMKQKVLILAALLHDPDLLIFDEPLSGLDVSSVIVFRHLVRMLADRGKAILYSSHVLEVVEKLCSRVVVLFRGQVAAHDSPQNLRELMSRQSLEDVFTELVFREDPERIAKNVVDLVTSATAQTRR